MKMLYENKDLTFKYVADEREPFDARAFDNKIDFLNNNGVAEDFAIQHIEDLGEHIDDLLAFGVRFVNNGYLMEMDIVVNDYYGWGYNDCLHHVNMYEHATQMYFAQPDLDENYYDIELEQKVLTEIINNKTFQETVNKHITKQRLRLLGKGINYREVLIMGGK